MKMVSLALSLPATAVTLLAQDRSNDASAQTPDFAVWVAVGVITVGAVILVLKGSRRRGVSAPSVSDEAVASKRGTSPPPRPQITSEASGPVEPEYVSALYIPANETLPATDEWENRFEIKSTTSNRRYVISQHRAMRHWSCSCPGWRQYRHCKHLESAGLPPYERPHELHFQATAPVAPMPSAKVHPPELRDFPGIDLSSEIPPRYVIFDLETTGLDPTKHEIIEIGAIRVTHNSNTAQTFHSLVNPQRRVPKLIREKTGITQEMIERDGEPLATAIADFAEFIGDLPLVSYGADFDKRFLWDAAKRHEIVLTNRITCALKMARKAWPFLQSHALGDVAKAGNFDQNFECSTSDEGTHRALGDCKRTLMIYVAAAKALGYATGGQARSAGA